MTWNPQPVRAAVLALLAGLLAPPAAVQAQGFDPVTTRAAGMGGAFVAVADDASAVYWNPAALASGAFFSLLVDRTSARALGDDPPDALGGSRSGTLFALSTPPVGLSYYRLRSTWIAPNPTDPAASVTQTLITHHTGITLVHSLADGVSIGSTVRLVRGVAASGLATAGHVDDRLDEAGDLVGQASNTVDADVGISAVFRTLRAGLTVRNLAAPSFETAGSDTELTLERQGRAGVALTSPLGFTLALDIDLNAVRGPIGKVRDIAIGTEARILPKAFARAGLRLNTLGDEPGGRAPTVSFGGSYAALPSLWIDAEATVGAETGRRGWGVAARVGF
ncbi:MAG: conjugal transfer protein TraF [Vicinamibacterales bacterium]